MERFILHVPQLKEQLQYKKALSRLIREEKRPYGQTWSHVFSVSLDFAKNHVAIEKLSGGPNDMNRQIVERLAGMNIKAEPREMTLRIERPLQATKRKR